MAYVGLSMYHRREIIHYKGAILPDNRHVTDPNLHVLRNVRNKIITRI